MSARLVLCMAGLYKRFRDAGYTTPKYLLPLDGRPILGHIVGALDPDVLLLVANERDRGWEPAIRDAVGRGAEVIWVGDTSGQAETAAIGARGLGVPDGPVVFHNVDTIVRGRSLDHIGQVLSEADGFIDVFPQSSPAYSYVALDGDRVTDIAEKVVISSHATTGLYGFRSASAYLDAAAATTSRSKGEFYVSDVYRTMLARGAVVRADPVGLGHATLVLGTPAEYEAAVAG